MTKPGDLVKTVNKFWRSHAECTCGWRGEWLWTICGLPHNMRAMDDAYIHALAAHSERT